MNTAHLLGAEAFVAIGINSFQAVKQGAIPYPGTLCRTGAAFGILACFAFVDEDLAGLLGAGFLLALLVMQAQSGWAHFGALAPTGTNYTYLHIGTTGATAGTPGDES